VHRHCVQRADVGQAHQRQDDRLATAAERGHQLLAALATTPRPAAKHPSRVDNDSPMGYELHVFRGSQARNPDPIETDVWDRVLAAESMETVEFIEVTTPDGDVIRIPGPILEWTGHSSGRPMPLTVEPGRRISVKAHDDETVEWLVGIAERLGAQVAGDEGEIYYRASDGKIAIRRSPDTSQARDQARSVRSWRFGLRRRR
jgi:hypothetical protein